MISLSVGYAIRSLVYLASKHEQGKYFTIKVLADDLSIPGSFLGKILQQLAKRDIIRSVKGPNGGFTINGKTLGTTVFQVVDVFDNVNSFNRCGLGIDKCSSTSPCPLHEHLKKHRDSLMEALRTQTIATLCEEYEKGNTVLSHDQGK